MEASHKKTLRAISLEIRHILEGTYNEYGQWQPGYLERRLNELGIWRDREPKPVEEMIHLSAEDKAGRQVVDAYINFRNEAGVTRQEAVAEFVRESAYTWFNRLFALRCMEARGIIDEIILQKEAYGGRSMVHNRFVRKNPAACSGEDEGLFTVLFNEFSERSGELPSLFNLKAPAVALRPSMPALKKCIALLSGIIAVRNQEPASDEVFEAADAFGWAYQYWNAEEKDRVFEMVRTKKGAKIEGADIIPATQLYTEPYMVKFLVQNSLGALWMGMYPGSRLYEGWEYYVKDADCAPLDKKPVAEITFLDPACGSGHFLIEAFDLFYSMYEEEGKMAAPEEICAAILNNNLFGIEIDERAVQIATAALWMKAKEKAPELDASSLKAFRHHLVATNIRLPKGKDHLEAFLKKYPDDAPLRPALETVFEGLENAHELGSLLQIEEPVEKELRYLKDKYYLRINKGVQQTFFDPAIVQGEFPLGVDTYEQWKVDTLARLRKHFDTEAEVADPVQSFFGRAVGKGLALFDLLARRYDVVATNPPYMGSVNMGDNLRLYCQIHFEKSKYDLFSVFIERCNELLVNNGILGLITQESWLSSQQFEKLRIYFLKHHNFRLLVHIGPHGFSEIGGGKVSSALISMQKGNSFLNKNNKLIAYRLIDIKNAKDKEILLKQCINLENNSRKFLTNIKKFLSLPKAPIAYWASDKLLDLIASNKSLGILINNANFTKTGNNNRFLRFYWEIKQNDFNIGSRWVWISKGVRFSRWQGSWNVVIDWSEGARLHYRKDKVARITDEEFWAIPGLTYCTNSTLGLAFRMINRPGVATYNSPHIFSKKISNWFLLAFLNSRFSTYIIRLIAGPLAVVIGDIQRIPCPNSLINEEYFLVKIAQISFKCKEFFVTSQLDESDFEIAVLSIEDLNIRKCVNSISFQNNIYGMFLSLTVGINDDFIVKKLGIESEKKNIIDLLGIPAGWLPIVKGYGEIPDYPDKSANISNEFFNSSIIQEDLILKTDELDDLKYQLRLIYEAGPRYKVEDDGIDALTDITCYNKNDEVAEDAVGTRIPIPAETFFEELSIKLEINPISVFWLLKEGIEEQGWRCKPEEKRLAEDIFTVIILRLLSHRWPKQIEAGESVPEWADKDGIIPITEGCGELTLLERVRQRIEEEFPGGNVSSIEREFEEIVGMTLEKWLAGPFFKRHISQFKKRPIAWQIESQPIASAGGKGRRRGAAASAGPAFSCLVYYHKLDADLLPKIRSLYVGPLHSRYETELQSLDGIEKLNGEQSTRKMQLERWIEELKIFDKNLQEVARVGFDCKQLSEIINKEALDEWTSADGITAPPVNREAFLLQECRYDPDINDGVRVNIAPLQKAGLLAAEVIAKKDVDKAIADRAEWRADERRWCREGKLPRPGWWKEAKHEP